MRKLVTTVKARIAAVFLGLALAGQWSVPVTAQGTFGEDELVRLSSILGGVHYIRSKCSRSERQVWRDRMQTLLKIEQPSQLLENKMVGEFNAAYKRQERKYSRCNRDAKDEAKRLAVEGQGLIARMTEALE